MSFTKNMNKNPAGSEKKDAGSFRELNILIKISRSIISTLDFQEVLQIISDGMAELMGIESAAIYLTDKEDEIFLGATTPPMEKNIPDFVRKFRTADHPFIQKTIFKKRPQIIADTRKVPLSPSEKKIIEMRQLRSLLFLPFIQEESVLGVLILGTCNQSRIYSEHEVNLGQTLANQLSVAIQNSRLHSDILQHKQNLEKLVKEKTQDLDAAVEELQAANEELYTKNQIIEEQNQELLATLNHLKTTQSQLVQAEKMASLGTLTAGIAHEINNPLNFLHGAYLGLESHFRSNELNSSENPAILMDSLKAGIDRISNIVKGLSHFSRENTNMNETCSVHNAIDNCLFLLNNQLKHRITVKKDYCKEAAIIKGNSGKIHQVFMNILLNSLQAIPDKGNIYISTRAEPGGNILVTEIRDTGEGIREEHLKKITDPFFTTKEPGKGTGLGLSIAYSIIQEHNGTLEFESEYGKGTKARIILPLS
jgi:signal transduction histidine kinase